MTPPLDLQIVPATERDVPLILSFIRELAEYEHLAHEVAVTEPLLREHLFGACRCAEVILGYARNEPVAFALFFQSFSTFLGRPGIYLEDLYVRPAFRGRGIGRAMLRHVARLAIERRCGRFEWAVLDWNEPAIKFYESLGAKPMNDWTTFRLTGEALQRFAEAS